MIEYDNKEQMELYDILQESIGIGLGKAANVIGQLTDSHVDLSTTKVYTKQRVSDLPMFSEQVIIMELEGDVLKGETVFSMSDDQLIKLIKHLEGLDDIDLDDEDTLALITDTYQEIGNIILGNIISSMADFFGISVDINVPYVTGMSKVNSLDDQKLLVVDVVFTIDKINAGGKLYMINDFNAYMKLAKWAKEEFDKQ